MALRALQSRVRVGQREHGMIEVRRIPARCRVAIHAIRGSEHRTGSCMHGVIRLLPRRQVASRSSAVRRGSGEDVVDVALCAGHTDVPSRQWKLRQAVVEGGV